MEQNLISQAIEIVGLAKLAKALGVTYQAIRKWETKGRLPRTEWTGETDYAALIEVATEGKVLKAALLSMPTRTAAVDVENSPKTEVA
jgi:DNA-binding transcriptional regulator YdaS (Cro superfamily)